MGCGMGLDSPAIAQLNPTLRSIALQVVNQSGGKVGISSGWRSNAQQTSLYNRWISGQYDVPAVAKPGTSHHETGLAVDFCGDLRLAQQLGHQLGLIFPVKGEAWHGELGEGVQASGEPNWQEMGIQYNLNYTGGRPVNPQEVLANRMASIMSLIGGEQFTSGATQMMDPLVQAQQYISPTTEQAGNPFMLDPTGSAQLPEAGPRQTSPLAPSQYMQPQVQSGTGLDDMQVGLVQGGDKSQLGAYAQSLFGEFGFTQEDFPALVWLWNKESGDPRAGANQVTWNPLAQNPTSTAFGIAQFLNGTWAGTGIGKTTNPMQQIRAGLIYIKNRYGNPRNALAFHNRNNWY